MADPKKKVGVAKALRRRMTAAERCLWSRLRAYRFHGLHFLRQFPVGPYIADFYCSNARLIVELDGQAHCLTEVEDRARQTYLEAQGISVLHFPNFAVMDQMDLVLDKIYGACSGHLMQK